jgi:mRNA interferase RelE/StbE
MNYNIIIPKPVQKQFDSLSDNIHERIISRILALKNNPRPRGCVKLKGYDNEYRIRIGEYRIRYEIDDSESIVIMCAILMRYKGNPDIVCKRKGTEIYISCEKTHFRTSYNRRANY